MEKRLWYNSTELEIGIRIICVTCMNPIGVSSTVQKIPTFSYRVSRFYDTGPVRMLCGRAKEGLSRVVPHSGVM